MAKIQLDMAGDVVGYDIVFDDGSKLSESLGKLKLTILMESGAGGGWPLVEIEGDRDDIINFLRNEYCDCEDDVQFHIDEVLEG